MIKTCITIGKAKDMKSIAIDILTPKQALFFNEVARLLKKRDIEVFCTTRRYFEVEEILKLLGLEAVCIGKHGGASLQGKLEAYADRVRKMTSHYIALKPDLVLSFSSPEAARTAFGLSIPHLTVNDSPHAIAVAKLTIPLSSLLLTPWIISSNEWSRFGIEKRRIIHYKGLDPVSWLKEFKPSLKILDYIGLDKNRPIVTVRPPEYLAAYLRGGEKIVLNLAQAVKRLLLSRPDLQVVVLSRYGHASKNKRIFGKKVIVTEKVVDGKNLLNYSNLFIGAGGTMTAEAALLGVPTISVYPGKTIIEDYLIRREFIVKATNNLYAHILQQIERPKEELRLLKRRASAMLTEMENPARKIAKVSERYLRS
ncbi:MAG: DUF354 domain-containing protein [Nitrososphaerales archaeon]